MVTQSQSNFNVLLEKTKQLIPSPRKRKSSVLGESRDTFPLAGVETKAINRCHDVQKTVLPTSRHHSKYQTTLRVFAVKFCSLIIRSL